MNNGRWSANESNYVHENYKEMTIKDMAKHLNKTEMAVQLYMHRKRLAPNAHDGKIIIQELLKLRFQDLTCFTPTPAFYKAVGITSQRWWNLFYGRKKILQEEYIRICTYFNISLQEAFDAHQLTIWEDNNEE